MYPFVFLGWNSERNVIFGWTIPLRSCRGNRVSSQRAAACCRVLLFIQSESSCALLISLFLPEWEERGETANYSPAQHIIHTLRCEPMERQMIFCFKIIRFISISVLSRISHLLRFSFSLSAGASSSFTFLQVEASLLPANVITLTQLASIGLIWQRSRMRLSWGL